MGAIAGAWLLTATNAQTFTALVPWLLLIATVTFAFGPAIPNWTKGLTVGRPVLTDPSTVGNDFKS